MTLQKQRYLFRFNKRGLMVFISHLDLMHLFERTFKMVKLPVVYTEGFNPHIRLSLPFPLALGYTGKNELGEVYLSEQIESKQEMARINKLLPADIQLLEFKLHEKKSPFIDDLDSLEYKLIFKDPVIVEDALVKIKSGLIVQKKNKKGEMIDQRLADYLVDLKKDESGLKIKLKLHEGQGIRIDNLVASLGVTDDQITEVERSNVALK